MIKVDFSSLSEATYGAWSTTEIEAKTVFGPIDADENMGLNEHSSMETETDVKPECKAEENNSNWMKYVNCARTKEEENLVTFESEGSLFFMCSKTIPPNTELLVDDCKRNDCWKNKNPNMTSVSDETDPLEEKPCTKQLEDNLSPTHDVLIPSDILAVQIMETEDDDEKSLNPITNGVDEFSDTTVKNSRKEEQDDDLSPSHYEHDVLIPSDLLAIQMTPTEDNDKPPLNLSAKSRKKSSKTKVKTPRKKTPKSILVPSDLLAIQMTPPENDDQQLLNPAAESTSKDESEIPAPSLAYEREQCVTPMDLLAIQMAQIAANPFRCEECACSFSSPDLLERHMLAHTYQIGNPYKRKNTEYLFGQAALMKYMKTQKKQRFYPVKTKEKSFKCEECEYATTTADHLRRHMLTHTGEKPFKCNECESAFTTNSDLKRHRRCHTEEKPFKCNFCGNSYTRQDNLNVHLRTHNEEKPFKCSECDQCFKLYTEVKKHMSSHADDKPFQCDECLQCFARADYLKSHMKIHSGEKPFKCDECGVAYTRSSHLLRHIKTHSGVKDQKCKICGKLFMTSDVLKKHMKIHARETQNSKDQKKDTELTQNPLVQKTDTEMTQSPMIQKYETEETKYPIIQKSEPYQCDLCGKGFALHSDINDHMWTHSEENPCTCNACDKCTTHSTNLERHVSHVTPAGEEPFNTDEKPFDCDISDNSSSASSFETHTNSKIKAFPCSECEYIASTFQHLRDHVLVHTGEKPYKCDQCESAFTKNSDLKRHIRTHTQEKPFLCDKCESSFTRSDTLKQHMKTHTGEKLFQCDQCESSFTRSGHLTMHKRIHTGEKPYECQECGKFFTQSSSLKKHMMQHAR